MTPFINFSNWFLNEQQKLRPSILRLYFGAAKINYLAIFKKKTDFFHVCLLMDRKFKFNLSRRVQKNPMGCPIECLVVESWATSNDALPR